MACCQAGPIDWLGASEMRVFKAAKRTEFEMKLLLWGGCSDWIVLGSIFEEYLPTVG